MTLLLLVLPTSEVASHTLIVDEMRIPPTANITHKTWTTRTTIALQVYLACTWNLYTAFIYYEHAQ